MLVSIKALSGFLKQSAFTKHLLIYLLQQTKVFNCGLNVSQKLKAFERILNACPAEFWAMHCLIVTLQMSTFSFLIRVLFQEYSASGLRSSVSNFFKRLSLPNKSSYQKLACTPLQQIGQIVGLVIQSFGHLRRNQVHGMTLL